MPAWGTPRTAQTKALQRQAVKRDKWCTCKGCPRCEGQPCERLATEGDHVVPLSQGGPDVLSNMAGLCHLCHQVKSSREAVQARVRRRHREPPSHPGAA